MKRAWKSRESWRALSSAAPQTTVRAVHAAGLLALAASAAFWAARLQAPVQAVPAPPAPAVAAPVDPAASAVAAWLTPGPLRLNVTVAGLIRRHDRAVAVLAVNGAAPRPFMAGETLMHGVTLTSVEPTGVTLDRAGTPVRIDAPVPPVPAGGGIVRLR